MYPPRWRASPARCLHEANTLWGPAFSALAENFGDGVAFRVRHAALCAMVSAPCSCRKFLYPPRCLLDANSLRAGERIGTDCFEPNYGSRNDRQKSKGYSPIDRLKGCGDGAIVWPVNRTKELFHCHTAGQAGAASGQMPGRGEAGQELFLQSAG